MWRTVRLARMSVGASSSESDAVLKNPKTGKRSSMWQSDLKRYSVSFVRHCCQFPGGD